MPDQTTSVSSLPAKGRSEQEGTENRIEIVAALNAYFDSHVNGCKDTLDKMLALHHEQTYLQEKNNEAYEDLLKQKTQKRNLLLALEAQLQKTIALNTYLRDLDEEGMQNAENAIFALDSGIVISLSDT